MNFPSRKAVLQFIKFGLVGVSNTLISLAIYYVFLAVDERLYLVGNVVGWIVSVANSFFWNKKYVFAGKNDDYKESLKKLIKTYLCYGGTFLLSELLLFIQVDILNWSSVVCPVINLLITIPINFVLNKFWAFSDSGKS